jgi:cell wall-associated NlpC family hydrolase
VWMVAGKAAQTVAKVGADKMRQATGGQQKKKKKAGIVAIAGVTGMAVCAGAAMLFMVLLISMIGTVGGGSAAQAAIASSCGVNRGPVAIESGTASGSLTGVVPGSLVTPMAKDTYTLSSPFGMRWGDLHDGQDFAAPMGTPIYAAGDGDVIEAGPADGYGLWIRIKHTIDGQPVETLYGHMDTIAVNTGQHVMAGQQIATVGNRGFSTGAHLHFGVYPGGWSLGGGVDPMPWLKQEATAGGPATMASAAPSTTAPPAATPTNTTAAPSDPNMVTAADWEKLADCEAGGNWAANTGNGFYGGLQFTLQTWESFGGKNFAQSPDKATKEQQMEVANKVLTGQGWGAWPTCSANKGLTGKAAAPAGTFVSGSGTQSSQAATTTSPQPNVVNASATTPPANCSTATSSAELIPGTVPEQYLQAVIAAGSVCPEITPPIIASQLEQESNWNPEAVSADPDGAGPDQGGALGMTQFMPGTWVGYGKDSGLDKSGKQESSNTPADPFNPYDAIASQANYDCHIAEVLRPQIASGKVNCPDIVACILAGYNSGEGAVLNYGGIPPFPQTQAYVVDIQGRMSKYTQVGATRTQPGAARPFTVAGSAFAQALVAAASTQVGMPYVWGGGDKNGPTDGGFDCSGLVLYAVAKASNGATVLPHLTNDQVTMGQKIDKSNIQPGDAVFSNGTGHVAIWLGDNKVLEAQTFGVPVGVHDFDISNVEDVRRYG